MKLDRKGIGSATVLIVLAAVAFGTVGPPVLADAVDTQPDHPLYSLERIGETIKGPFVDGRTWNLSLAEERVREFANMAGEGKAEHYTNLVSEADTHLSEAVFLSEGTGELGEASKALAKNIAILEDVKTKSSEDIEVKISRSQLRNFLKLRVIENITEGETPNISELEGRIKSVDARLGELKKVPDFEITVKNYPNPASEDVEISTENVSDAIAIGNIYLENKKYGIRRPENKEFENFYENVNLLRWEGPENTQPTTYTEYAAELLMAPFDVNLEYSTEATEENLVYVLVDGIYDSLEGSLLRYANDLEGEGYRVNIYSGAWGEPKEVRNFLQDAPSELVGALFVGNIPTAWYEINNDYGEYGHVEFPIDLYYMDLDGLWIDEDEDGVYDGHIGTSGDSHYDNYELLDRNINIRVVGENLGDLSPEIFIGRLKGDVLSGDERSLLKDYFDRNHEYRKENTYWVTQRGALVYVDDDWASRGDSWNEAVRTLFKDTILESDPDTTTATNYKDNLRYGSWTLIHVASHSRPRWHVFNNGSVSSYFKPPYLSPYERVYSSEIRNISPNASFYNLFACSAARYIEKDYIAGWYLFNEPHGLAVVGSTKTGSMLDFQDFYRPLSENKTIGESFKEWFTKNGEKSRSWFYGMTLLGDPTLHIRNPPFRLGKLENVSAVIENQLENENVILAPLENLKIHFENENDIDKDGIPDWYEKQEMAQWGADPNHRDIFVEIDRMEDSGWFVPSVKQELRGIFENSPIINPDGTTGVKLHLVESDVVPSVDEFDSSMLTEYIENYKDHGRGFYYCLLLGDSVGYGATAVVGAQGFYFYPSAGLDKNYSEISSTFMYELGHCLGLFEVFDGIDSYKYSFPEYRSVMNYSSPNEFYNYSSGPPFDDWEYLENEGFFLPTFREDIGVENIGVERQELRS